MKRVAFSSLLIASLSGSAIAADLPSVKSAPLTPPPASWTGFYAGLNVGGGTGSSPLNVSGLPYDPWGVVNNQAHAVTLPSSIPWWNVDNGLLYANSQNTGINQAGIIGGIQFGYNYQATQNIVVGGEVDFQGSSISGNKSYSTAGQDTLYTVYGSGFAALRDSVLQTSASSSINWFGTVRGRVGYLVTPSLLAYATGGLTYAGVQASSQTSGYSSVTGRTSLGAVIHQGDSPILSAPTSSSNTLVGWNAGGGMEWMFKDNWSLKGEAFYYNLGSWNLPTYVVGAATPTTNSQQFPTWISTNKNQFGYNGVIARVGVNYHFNLANVVPVVAKY